MKPSGFEPAIFRFVAQNLNHCATAVPQPANYLSENKIPKLYVRYPFVLSSKQTKFVQSNATKVYFNNTNCSHTYAIYFPL